MSCVLQLRTSVCEIEAATAYKTIENSRGWMPDVNALCEMWNGFE